MRHAAILTLSSLALACGSSAPPTLDPDVSRFAGGCVLTAAPGKVINANPAADVRVFGTACNAGAGTGGIVYLDRFDPVSGDGDVTVLSSAAGASPVVVARHGGGASIEIGNLATRIDGTGSRLLTLANVGFVTGDLVEVPLPAGQPVRAIASAVRVENYDFVAGGGVLYVGNYDANHRTGDLAYADGGELRLIVAGASRFDFLMYRLSPDASRVAYLLNWTEDEGGALEVQALPPTTAPSSVAQGVFRMAWTSEGRLVYRTVNPDRITYSLWSWDGTNAPLLLAPEADSASVVGDQVLFTTGWSVLEQRAALHLVSAGGGDDLLGGAGPASLQITAAAPPGSSGLLAYFVVPDVTVATEGDLHVSPLSAFVPRPIDTGVTIAGGVGVSPRAGLVSYALGFAAPQVAGSANPQPGIARQLKIAPVGAGPPFVLATDASTFVAWDPLDRFAAAIGSFDPASNRGALVVRRVADASPALAVADVGNAQFGFADDGSLFWAIQGWDDAQQRGQLVVAAIAGDGAWTPVVVADDVTWAGPATNGHVLYGVRGGRKDGIWSAAVR